MTGEELKIRRATLGLSQSELAEELELTQNTVSRYEIGKLPIPKLVALAVDCLVEKKGRGPASADGPD